MEDKSWEEEVCHLLDQFNVGVQGTRVLYARL